MQWIKCKHIHLRGIHHINNCVRSPPPSSDSSGDIIKQNQFQFQDSKSCRIDSPINMDAFEEPQRIPLGRSNQTMRQCCGIQVNLPAGKSTHISYPFGLHEELGDLWNYSVMNGVLVLCSKGCVFSKSFKLRSNSSRCQSCEILTKNAQLDGVLWRIEMGVHENSHLAYHSIGGLVTLVRQKHGELKALQLRKLNDARKLVQKAAAMDNLKQWVMEVGSGRVECVNQSVPIDGLDTV